MRKILTTLSILMMSMYSIGLHAFCGFYVAKADAKIFNKTSQVILARNGDQTTVTMSSDFEGTPKDFAMVIPVPVVLKKNQIKTVDASIFTTLNDYSAPRIASYYDPDPCNKYNYMWCNGMDFDLSVTSNAVGGTFYFTNSNQLAVKVEAKYEIEEYDIILLSSTDSKDLETWLTQNGYKIPRGAQEVLTPYIQNDMKFFVVKVNMDRFNKKAKKNPKGKEQMLDPIQVTYNSPKFMLPIRLGMANAKEAQDMIVYAFSKWGEIEVTNYKTEEIPTNKDIPLFVQDTFNTFYKDVFNSFYEKGTKDLIYKEYTWDVSPRNTVKCDPCVGDPPVNTDLLTAGVDWIEKDVDAKVYFTRLHIRYDKEHFPQDLLFQETAKKERFQARYVIHYPFTGDCSCEKGQAYVKGIKSKRIDELYNMHKLAGWDIFDYAPYAYAFENKIKKELGNLPSKKENKLLPIFPSEKQTPSEFSPKSVFFFSFLAIIFIILFWGVTISKNKTVTN